MFGCGGHKNGDANGNMLAIIIAFTITRIRIANRVWRQRSESPIPPTNRIAMATSGDESESKRLSRIILEATAMKIPGKSQDYCDFHKLRRLNTKIT